MRVADENARFRIPAGVWSIAPGDADSPWRPGTTRLDLASGDQGILWAVHPYDLEIVVQGNGGFPVEGAIVRWLARPLHALGGWPPWQEELRTEEVTNTAGRVRFEDLTTPSGTVAVLADGYEACVWHLSGARGQTVVLSLIGKSLPPRTVQFLAEGSGLPLAGVRLLTTVGLVPGASDAEGLLLIPSWLPRDEVGYLHGGAILPVEIGLDALEGQVILALRSMVVIELSDGSGHPIGPREPVMCLVDMAEPASVAAGTPSIPSDIHWQGPTSPGLSLPMGYQSIVTIIASSGGWAETPVFPVSATMTVPVRLTAAPALVIHASTAGGVEATAQVRVRYGSYRRE
ncbi:MAG: hypothetical protein AB1793_09525 [Candidatus Thermoplasmatota archaeon]